MTIPGIITLTIVGLIVGVTFFATSRRVGSYMFGSMKLWTGPYFREVPDGRTPGRMLEYIGPPELLDRHTKPHCEYV